MHTALRLRSLGYAPASGIRPTNALPANSENSLANQSQAKVTEIGQSCPQSENRKIVNIKPGTVTHILHVYMHAHAFPCTIQLLW